MAALIIDSISWASIGIPVCLHSLRIATGDRSGSRAELSAAALLRHALSHYIPDPILAKPLGRMALSQRLTEKAQNHETPRSRPPQHHHGEPDPRPRPRGRRRDRR